MSDLYRRLLKIGGYCVPALTCHKSSPLVVVFIQNPFAWLAQMVYLAPRQARTTGQAFWPGALQQKLSYKQIPAEVPAI